MIVPLSPNTKALCKRSVLVSASLLKGKDAYGAVELALAFPLGFLGDSHVPTTPRFFLLINMGPRSIAPLPVSFPLINLLLRLIRIRALFGMQLL